MPPRRRRQASSPETPEGNAQAARETRVRVRFRCGVSAESRSFRAGEVLEVDQAVADAWVAAGWARVEDE